MKRYSTTIILLFLCFNLINAQFINFNTNIDSRQIRESDQFYFENLKDNINEFFIVNSFGTDIDYLEIDASLHLIIESIIESDNQKLLNGQLIITNKSDIIMILKNFSFPIRELKNISYNQNFFSPFSSLLEFSAYILIANELDTYESKGGNAYYNMAQLLAVSGKESNYSKGWTERWKKCKQIQDNFFLRDMKYYFFLIYDNLYNNRIDSLDNYTELLHQSIISNDNFIGIDNNTKNFFNAYSKDLSKYYSEINFKEGLKYLTSYDIDNKLIYQNALDSLK